MTISQWVRYATQALWRQEPSAETERKLMAVREALRHSYPTADIDQMLEETGRGYMGTAGYREADSDMTS